MAERVNWWANWKRVRAERTRSQLHEYLRFRPKDGENQQVPAPPPKKETVHARMTWSELKRHAAESEVTPADVLNVERPSSPQGDPLLDAALEKATHILRNDTGLDDATIRGELLARLMQNRLARTSALSAVRFCADANGSWFTECEECGAENDPLWDVCSRCEAPRAA